ncbi:MAG: tetratricopeptide repeat protein [Burkholderiales bacterium]|nr:tetratricopeptide repeat protein [Burkholderiales bacterium]
MTFLKRLFSGISGPASAPDAETLERWVREAFEQHLSGKHEQAQELFRQVLDRDPRRPDVLYFLGCVAAEDRRELEAIHFFEQAVEARPVDAEFRFALGLAQFNIGRFEAAEASFRAAVRLQPDHADAVGNLWMTELELGRDEEVRAKAEQARSAGGEGHHIDVNLATIYRTHGRIDEAIEAGRRVVRRAPQSADAFSNLLLTLHYSEALSPRELFAEHRRYAAIFARPYLAPLPERTWPRRLRVGYVSPDFRAHVVALFFEPILESHDRERFEIFCYHNHRTDDPFTARLRANADHWIDCVHLTDAELADRIRNDRIDILVDLAGHTGYNRLKVFATKPAPVQVTYLGYPNTTGLTAIDYRISDARADPPGEADRLSAERLLRLPACFHCFRPLEDSPEVAPPPAAGAGYVTFGCFNNFAKLSDGFLDAAARVLAGVPGSRLKLKGKPLSVPDVAARIRQRFARAGIDPQRLELVPWQKTPGGHLAVHGSVDIALDSFPYNGTTTTCEALWMGVPVVTFTGDRHSARVGASLLHAVGLDDLVARDVDGYVATAVRLAADRARLSELRGSLRERVRRSPLRDEAALTAAIESAYLDIWQARIAGTGERALSPGEIAEKMRRAGELRASGSLAEACEVLEEVLLGRADHLEALTAIWEMLFDSGSPGSAVDWINKAIAARGDVAMFHYMLGCCFQAQAKVDDAVTSFARAVELDPRFAKAFNNLGCTLEASGNLRGALECYDRALELDTRLAQASYNKGNALRQLGDLVNAIVCMRAGLAIDPRHADWHCNLGDLLFDGLELDDAVASYRRAIEVDAGYARGWLGLGMCMQGLGRNEEAETHLRKAIELDPKLAQAGGNLLLVLHNLHGDDAGRMLAEHRAWAKRHATGIPWQAARTDEERRRRGRLKIGYLSPDFRRHPVADFIEPVLASHDRHAFQVFCYSTTTRPDATTRRIEALCEHWRDVSGVRDDLIAERMRFDAIDILVDLAGHTGGGRMALMARKLAPVQVSWLGYPNTTGLHAIDYRFTDSYADPLGASEAFHAEKLLRLPDGFLCYRPPAGAPAPGAAPARARGYVTFGSFNNLSKLTDAMVALWSRILASVPRARLVLKAYGLAAASARRELLARFARHGIGAERLELLPPLDAFDAHLAAYLDIDIALDTFPYNGTTTTLEALWMGVPVVSLAGKTHVARVGLSILSRAGLADLVASGPEEYLAKAVALAQDAGRRDALRAGMRERLRDSPLLAEKTFTRGLEGAYREIWEAYAKTEERPPMRLHIGGKQTMVGWKILNVQPGPGVDFVADCSDLGAFEDGSVDEIYASHVIEHLSYRDPVQTALREFHRVLKRGGTARIGVPDFERLCRLYLDPRHSDQDRFFIMQMAFGGQVDEHDFHRVGFDFETLSRYLTAAGFSRVERVGDFGLFDDDSAIRFSGEPISLNVVAHK